MHFSQKKIQPYIGLLVLWAAIMLLTYNFSRDYFAYNCFFDYAASLKIGDRFLSPRGLSHDPAFFLVQGLGTLVLSFEVFFALLVLGALLLKLLALMQVTPSPTLIDILPYVCVLSFLHEGTQIRIAVALSIVLWGLICFAMDKKILALLLIFLGSLFHVSAATFFLVILLFYGRKRFGSWPFVIGFAIAAFLSFSPWIQEFVLEWGEAHQARYLGYATVDMVASQNSSGMFGYFIIFVAGVILSVWVLFKPANEIWAKLKSISLVSGYLALIVLLLFRFNVVISSRLSDLLLLPLVLVLGAMLAQLYYRKRIVLLTCAIMCLISYGILRGYVTYSPIAQSSECHPEFRVR